MPLKTRKIKTTRIDDMNKNEPSNDIRLLKRIIEFCLVISILLFVVSLVK